MAHAIGREYTGEEIRTEHNGLRDDIEFVVHGERHIQALRLRRSSQPRMSPGDPRTCPNIWIAERWGREPWAERLANDTGAFHLYLADTDRQDAYTYKGIYHIISSTRHPRALVKAEKTPGIEPLSWILIVSGPRPY